MVVESRYMPLDGANAVSQAMRQINPDVVAAYPITPQTAVVQHFSQYVADGAVDTEFVPVESEHAAMSACVGASAAGARVMTATAANGLALMWEMLYIASGMRLPIVLTVVNRALSSPLNIHCDHSDAMGARDSGWVQLFAETGQEAYDNTIQSVRIAEHSGLLTPVMSCQDGFITGHGVERVGLLPDDAVKAFVGTYTPEYALLDTDNPITMGAWDFTDYYFEHKRQQTEAMNGALPIIEAVSAEYAALSGRPQPILDMYEMDDADYAIIVLSSTAGTSRAVAREWRARGMKVGILKPRVFRPFPAASIVEAIANCKAVAVLDRAISFGAPQGMGPLFADVTAALYNEGVCGLKIVNYIFGLGGRDALPPMIESVFEDLQALDATGKREPMVRYLGLRE
ncbi:MAG: pyruvate ferredoxin oxidoreductase [Chloroflexi bacterium RBG_13_56_8]|nr:MAG: pyruvate ferredoxin oxidoreductase [Chloroflexi bacterium RBG_13_56_8]